ncbi:hypothetical protein OTU49_008461, partial [Cherax quadricarinatus]
TLQEVYLLCQHPVSAHHYTARSILAVSTPCVSSSLHCKKYTCSVNTLHQLIITLQEVYLQCQHPVSAYHYTARSILAVSTPCVSLSLHCKKYTCSVNTLCQLIITLQEVYLQCQYPVSAYHYTARSILAVSTPCVSLSLHCKKYTCSVNTLCQLIITLQEVYLQCQYPVS